MKLESKKVVGCGLVTASFLIMTGFTPITADALTQGQQAPYATVAFAQNSTWSDVLQEKNELGMKLAQMNLTKEAGESDKVALAEDETVKETKDSAETGKDNTVASLIGEAGHAGIAQVEDIVAELPAEEISLQQTAASPWDGKAMAKVDESANVRAEASTESDVVGCIYKGTRADVIEQGEEWTKIRSGKVTGYVSNEYLAFGEEAESLSKTDTKVMATVNTDGLRIRKEAGTDAEVSSVADKGSSFAVKAQDGDWVQIIVDGEERYVSAEFVEVARKYTKAKTIEQIVKEEEEKKAKEAAKAAVETASSSTASDTQKAAVGASSDTTSLLAALIYCEAGGECYDAKVAVGSVVMNRVRSASYPNSIRSVIYQSGQFGPAMTGKLDRVLANGSYTSSCVSAAKEALAGRDNVNGALYFGFGSRGIKIGSQCFY